MPKKPLRITLKGTKDLKNEIIVFYPHNMKVDRLPLNQEEFAQALFAPIFEKEKKRKVKPLHD